MQSKLILAIVLALALCTVSIVSETSVLAAKKHSNTVTNKHTKQVNTNTGSNTVNQTVTANNVTNQVNPLFGTGLKTICFNGVSVTSGVSTPSVICQAITIQKIK